MLFKKKNKKKKTFYGQTGGQPKTIVWNLTKLAYNCLLLDKNFLNLNQI
jgi:hypothetical protein